MGFNYILIKDLWSNRYFLTKLPKRPFPYIDMSMTLQKNFAETETALLDELIKALELLEKKE